MNPIGREILYTLDKGVFRYFPWTLKAGIENFELHFKENQNECIKRKENVHNFALENTQNIIRSINLATNYEVCSSYKETSSGEVKRTCCQITKSNSIKFNYGCSEPKAFIQWSRVPWGVIYCVMCFLSCYYFMWLLLVLLSRTEFDLKYPKYYKLEESRMSPSFILFKIIWEENGRVVSFIRRCVLTGVFSYCTCMLFWPIKILNVFIIILVLFWGLSFSISYLYRSKITNSSILLGEIKKTRNWYFHHWSFSNLEYFGVGVSELPQEVDAGEFAHIIKVLTLPFNVKVWRTLIKTSHSLFRIHTTYVVKLFRNRIFKSLALLTYGVLVVPIYSSFHWLLFLVYIIGTIGTFVLSHIAYMLVMILYLEYKNESRCSRFLGWFHIIGLALFPFHTLIVMIFAIMSFILGLFLNLVHFIPYFAFFSVLTFYCCSYWKTMEEKYCVLERLIYETCQKKQEACRGIQGVDNGCIPNRHPKLKVLPVVYKKDPKREGKVLPVVSKELYDKIREELLPYDTNLFYFGLKIFWSFVFSFGIFKLINMLNEFNVVGVVQVVTTASLGIMPHILNMVALKTSEERKKAWEEKLKLNVKRMVEELVREDPQRARTVFIIKKNDDTTVDENFQKFERVRIHVSCESTAADDTAADDRTADERDLIWSDNDDVDDPELAPTVIRQGNNDTRTDENLEDSERVEARFDLNPSDSDDGLRIVTIHSPPAKETPVRADDTPADDTTADDTTVNDPPADDTTADDTTAVDTTADGRATERRTTDENVRVTSDLNPSDNDDVENYELRGTVLIQENNVATDEEYFQDFELVRGLTML
jgi:hypothetical protein